MTDYLDSMVTAFAGPPVTEPRKAQRCKLLEEAAEAFAAAQECDIAEGMAKAWGLCTSQPNPAGGALADELADTIQAAVNLAAAHGITAQELDAALERCRERNRERGRL